MKSIVFSKDIDTLIGMRLAGIQGEIVKDKEDVLRRLHACVEDPEIGIVMLSKEVMMLAEKDIMELKLETDETLIVQIPELGKAMEDRITKYVRESIGVKF